MNTPTRLSLYGAGLVACFAAAFGVAAVVAPADAASQWQTDASHGEHDDAQPDDADAQPADEHGEHGGAAGEAEPANGVSLDSSGYRLVELTGPAEPGSEGELSFQIAHPDGTPVTEYTEAHDKDLHLIAVRSDGGDFHHVHPEMEDDGTWSVPITWESGGSYRVFADFVPGEAEGTVTLSRTVEVAGDYAPQVAAGEQREATVGDFQVRIDGDIAVGDSSNLTVTVTRDGEPVTEMEPYLGAYGHLVALRDGDLSYLHVHPEGAEPEPGQLSGPDVEFATEAPTAGRYLLYFDFQVDGQVHSAPFELYAGESPRPNEAPAEQSTSDDDHDAEEHAH